MSVFKKVYFLDVIHMVSHIDEYLSRGTGGIKVMVDTFPAGKLTGAPKYKLWN